MQKEFKDEVETSATSKSIGVSMKLILLGLLAVGIVVFSLFLFGGFNFLSLLEIPLAYYEIISKVGLGIAISATILLVVLGGRSNSSSIVSVNGQDNFAASNKEFIVTHGAVRTGNMENIIRDGQDPSPVFKK